MDVAGCRLRAFLKAGVTERVHDHMVFLAYQSLDHPETCCPAGGEQGNVIVTEELGDLVLECERERCVADQRGRAGAVDAEVVHGLDRRLQDRGMRIEAEVVLAREVDPVEQRAVVRARGAAAERALFGGAAQRPPGISPTVSPQQYWVRSMSSSAEIVSGAMFCGFLSTSMEHLDNP